MKHLDPQDLSTLDLLDMRAHGDVIDIHIVPPRKPLFPSLAVHHETPCPVCGIEKLREGLCLDCLEEAEHHTIPAEPAAELSRPFTLDDLLISILFFLAGCSLYLPVTAYLIRCLELWTGHPWP